MTCTLKSPRFIAVGVSLTSLLLSGCVGGVLDGDLGEQESTGTVRQALDGSGITVQKYIMVDLFGYRTDMKKVAVLVDPQAGYNANDAYTPGNTMELRKWDDRSLVTSGSRTTFNSGNTETRSGDKGWHFDFSAVTTAGSYYVYDATNNVRSHRFEINDAVYADVMKAALRFYYYQRINAAKATPYAQSPWTDNAAFMGANQDSQAKPICTYTGSKCNLDAGGAAKDVSGGWMDAGDYNKYVTFNRNVIHPLLDAYLENPSAFAADHNIPESGNGLPDVLDEVKYELDWIKKMQESNGGVRTKAGYCNSDKVNNCVTTWAFPPSANTAPRYYGPVCSSSTIAAAAMFAHAARALGQFSSQASYVSDLQTRAVNAWNHYHANGKSENCDNGEIISGDADMAVSASAEGNQVEYAVVAAVHLFALTGNSTYSNYVRDNLSATRPFRESSGNWTRHYDDYVADALLYYRTLPGADSTTVTSIGNRFSAAVNNTEFYLFTASKDLYRSYLPDEAHHWGSNSIRATRASGNGDVITYGFAGSNTASYKEFMSGTLNYFHGVNPFARTFLTNMSSYGAEASMTEIFHEWFHDTHPLNTNPAPGYLPGGVNSSYCTPATGANESWPCWNDPVKTHPIGKRYKDFNSSWDTTNNLAAAWELSEPGIYYQAAYVRLLSKFVGSPGWTPPPPPGSCTPESDSAFCSRLSATCGSKTANDNCGTSRTVSSCGTCSTGYTCTSNSCVADGGGGGGTGTISWEKWTNVTGTAVSNIPVGNSPNETGTYTSFEAPSNAGDNYGLRVRGYLAAPTTGSYTFWIAGDDGVELWLSTTSNSANKVKIAYHTGYTGSREWNKYATQKSAAVSLTAGSSYYIEALMKEGSGGDNLAVGWAKPGQSTTSPSEVIPGSALSPFSGGSCTPESDSAFCTRLGATCGSKTANDNCGTSRTVSSCGTCSSGYSCSSNTCVSSCTPETDATFCSRLGATCGSKTGTDNCGTSRTVSSCGTCSSGYTCSSNSCVASGSDSAVFNFESSTQNWVRDGSISSVAASTDRAYAGSQSLKATVNTGSGDGFVKVSNPGVTSGQTVTFRIWVPTGMPLNNIGAYVANNGCAWTANWYGSASLTRDAWNTLTVTAPSCTPGELGLKFEVNASWSGSAYIDSVNFGGGTCTPESDASFCSVYGATCGTVSGADNCGTWRTVSSCGTCASGTTCSSNTCQSSCTPESDSAFCSRLSATCGSKTGTDNCGNSRTVSSCGTCSSGYTCSSNTCVASGGDSAVFNFESSAQNWTCSNTASSVAASADRAYAGSQSLKVTFNTGNGDGFAKVLSPGVTSGKTVTFRVWVPSGMPLNNIGTYVSGNGCAWTANWYGSASLTRDAWNTMTVTVPSCTPGELGLKFEVNASWSGSAYVDSVNW